MTVLSLAGILFATMRPDANPPLPSHWCLICGTQGGVDAFLNVLLFFPIGVGLGISGARARWAVVGAFVLSALIETAQLTLIPGRDATLGDVVTNTCGAALGFAAARYFVVLVRPSRKAAVALILGWSFLWLGINAVMAFVFVEAIPQSYFYGQLARRLANFDLFDGSVLNAKLGSAPIPDSRIAESPMLYRLLLQAAPVTASVMPGSQTGRIAPIVRVVDSASREVVMVGQLGDALVLRRSTGAGILRLREPIFGVKGVFANPSPDSGQRLGTMVGEEPRSARIDLTTQYASTGVALQSESANRTVRKRLAVRATLGWVSLLPFQWVIEGSLVESVTGVLWVACLVLLPAYWSAFSGGRSKPARSWLAEPAWLLAVTVIVYAGIGAVPLLLGVGVASVAEWIIAAAAIFCGHIIGVSVRSKTAASFGPATRT